MFKRRAIYDTKGSYRTVKAIHEKAIQRVDEAKQGLEFSDIIRIVEHHLVIDPHYMIQFALKNQHLLPESANVPRPVPVEQGCLF